MIRGIMNEGSGNNELEVCGGREDKELEVYIALIYISNIYCAREITIEIYKVQRE